MTGAARGMQDTPRFRGVRRDPSDGPEVGRSVSLHDPVAGRDRGPRHGNG